MSLTQRRKEFTGENECRVKSAESQEGLKVEGGKKCRVKNEEWLGC